MELSVVPQKRKKYLNEIGKLLSSKHGRKKSYKIKAIQLACDKSKYSKDFGIHNYAWIFCAFTNESEFHKYYETSDLSLNYDKMRRIMLKGTSYEKILEANTSKAKGKFDMKDVSVDNIIDPTIIG